MRIQKRSGHNHLTLGRRWLRILALAMVSVGSPVAVEAELTGRLIIVTSFPETLFGRFARAFEKRHPKIKIHVRSKKTSAAISFIQERKGEPVDIIWASAPDAF